MELSSPIIDGDLGWRSGRFPKSSSPVTERGPRLSPHDCILPPLDFVDLGPQLPADGNFKAEVENRSPGNFKAEVENWFPVTVLSSTKKEGGLGQISAMPWNSPVTKPPPDCILPPLDVEYLGPQLPANGNFKAEGENGSPVTLLSSTMKDGGLGQISAMRWNSPFTDFDGIMLPKPPPGLLSEAKDEEASGKLGLELPNIIRGPDGQKAHIVYRPPTSYKRKDDAGREYPKAPPNYETVLRDRKGMFFHPYCKRYPCLVEWHAVVIPRYAYN